MISVHEQSGWWFRGKAPGQIWALKQASVNAEACSILRSQSFLTCSLHQPTARRSKAQERHSGAGRRPTVRGDEWCGSG